MSSTSAPSSEYSGDKLLIFTGIFVPVQIFCVALRYFARYLVHGAWGLDDIVVFTSLALQMGMAGISIGSVKNAGVGFHESHLEEVAPKTLITWNKYLVAISILYLVSVSLPKLAILALYRRLFPRKGLRIVIYVVAGVLISYSLSTVIVAFAACRPFAANWNPTIPDARCIDKEAFFIWSSLPNVITDLIMLILPVRVVWNLHATTRLKIGLTVTFAIGSFGLVTSIVRLTTFFHINSFIDGTWAAVDLIIWTQVEAGVYLISACLMTYRPLLERIGRAQVVGRLTHSIRTPNEYRMENTTDCSAENSLRSKAVADQRGFHKLGSSSRIDPGILVTTNVTVGREMKEGPQHPQFDGHR